MSAINSIQSQIEASIKAKGFERFGMATLEKPMSIEFYRTWLDENFNGDMNYLREHYAEKLEPQKLLDKAQTAIVIARNYYPHPHGDSHSLAHSRVALYAQGDDYHRFFLKELLEVCSTLKAQFPDHEFLPMTDSKPVLERDLAYRAGLGWVGKNTCLIDSKAGSLFFIGEIYTTLALSTATALHPDRCGTCTRCIDICPTDALVEPRKLDARKCISYLTIESRQVPNEKIRNQMQDWLFGCDLCQTVCPWNEKAFGPEMKEFSLEQKNVSSDDLTQELQDLLESSNKALQRRFKNTALDRAGANGLKRNALIVIANRQITALKSLVQSYFDHPKLGALAQWTYHCLESRPSSENPSL